MKKQRPTPPGLKNLVPLGKQPSFSDPKRNPTPSTTTLPHTPGIVPQFYVALSKKPIQRSNANYRFMNADLGDLIKELTNSSKSEVLEQIFLELLYRFKHAFDSQKSIVRGLKAQSIPIGPLHYLPVFHCCMDVPISNILRQSDQCVVALCQLFTQVPTGPMIGQLNQTRSESKTVMSSIVCNLLMALFNFEDKWPTLLLKCYLEDSSATERSWTEDVSCAEFVQNLQLTFQVNLPENLLEVKDMRQLKNQQIEKHQDSKQGRNSPNIERMASPLHPSKYLIKHRYPVRKDVTKILDHYVDTYVMKIPNSVQQPFPKNVIKTLVHLTKFARIQKIIIPKLENWLTLPKISRAAQDLLISLSMNLETIDSQSVELVKIYIIDTFPKKLSAISQSGTTSKAGHINQQMTSVLWRTVQTAFSNMAASNEELAEKILIASFLSETTLNYHQKNPLSSLNLTLISNLLFTSSPSASKLQATFAKLCLEEIWKRKKPVFDKVKEILKSVVLKCNKGEFCVNKTIENITKSMKNLFSAFDSSHEFFKQFITLVLDLFLYFIAIMSSADRNIRAFTDKDGFTLDQTFYQPASHILQDVVVWLTEQATHVNPLLIFINLQKTFFVDSKPTISELDFGQKTNILNAICKEIPITGPMLNGICMNMKAEHTQDILNLFLKITQTRKVHLQHDEADTFFKYLTSFTFCKELNTLHGNKKDLVLFSYVDHYWRMVEYMLFLCGKSNELRSVVHAKCFEQDACDEEALMCRPLRHIIEMLIKGELQDKNLENEERIKTALESYISGLGNYSTTNILLFHKDFEIDIHENIKQNLNNDSYQHLKNILILDRQADFLKSIVKSSSSSAWMYSIFKKYDLDLVEKFPKEMVCKYILHLSEHDSSTNAYKSDSLINNLSLNESLRDEMINFFIKEITQVTNNSTYEIRKASLIVITKLLGCPNNFLAAIPKIAHAIDDLEQIFHTFLDLAVLEIDVNIRNAYLSYLLDSQTMQITLNYLHDDVILGKFIDIIVEKLTLTKIMAEEFPGTLEKLSRNLSLAGVKENHKNHVLFLTLRLLTNESFNDRVEVDLNDPMYSNELIQLILKKCQKEKIVFHGIEMASFYTKLIITTWAGNNQSLTDFKQSFLLLLNDDSEEKIFYKFDRLVKSWDHIEAVRCFIEKDFEIQSAIENG